MVQYRRVTAQFPLTKTGCGVGKNMEFKFSGFMSMLVDDVDRESIFLTDRQTDRQIPPLLEKIRKKIRLQRAPTPTELVRGRGIAFSLHPILA